MIPFKTQAHINSLDGKMDEITVLEKVDDSRQPYYIVDYRGVKCTAILIGSPVLITQTTFTEEFQHRRIQNVR